MSDSNAVSALTGVGKFNHIIPDFFGTIVVFDLFPVGTRGVIEEKVSGLDSIARRVITDLFDVAYALRSIGGYDFKASLEEKLKVVKALEEPVFEMLVEELRGAQRDQREAVRKLREDLKKSPPNQG